MLHLDILQNQWILVALLAGVILVLGMVLAYLAIWQPLERRRVPWILLMTYLGILAFMVVYLVMRARTPPNW